MSAPLRVLVVDDSAVVREALSGVLGSDGLTVVTAADPVIARGKIAAQRPDVIVLDLAMPRQDGLSFLRELMATDPIPVVICSALSTQGSRAALEALQLGAVEVVAKPTLGVREFFAESATLILDAVRAAARARLAPPALPARAPATAAPMAASAPVDRRASSRRLIAIAASTGGPQAIQEVLAGLPPDAPGIVVVQHMPAAFTEAFAKHLDATCAIAVREATDGATVRDGCALIAPGGRHLLVHRDAHGFAVEVACGPLVSRHRPSADVLFRSAARAAGPDAVGVLMTGMGDDGADGLLAMRRAGAATIAQDEASSVVFGMPKAAIALAAADEVLPLPLIARGIMGRAAAPTAEARRSG